MTEYHGRLSTPVVNLEGFDFPSLAEWAHRSRVAQAKQEAYNRSIKGRICNELERLRGALADWIAPNGWRE